MESKKSNKNKKDDIIAIVGTILFHIGLFLLFYYTVIRTVVPTEDEGVLVNFGSVNLSAGVFEPRYTGDVIRPTTTPPPVTAPEPRQEEVLTQDQEETVAVPDASREAERRRQEQERLENERRRAEEAERQRIEEERLHQEQAISNRVAGAFGSGEGESQNQGDGTETTGNQGSPFGNAESGQNTGTGGWGSFNLNGRTIGAGGLPRPAYSAQEEGRIVINITVNPRGEVIFAEIGRGTNIDNASMRNNAIEAAKMAKFNSIQGTNNQQGTITYNYSLR